MENSVGQFGRIPCAYIIEAITPLESLLTFIEMMMERKVELDMIVLQNIGEGKARIYFHCSVERDRLKHFERILRGIKGVVDVTLLGYRGHNACDSK